MRAVAVTRPMSARADEVIVVGSGLAGLACALALAPRPVTLVTKTMRLSGGATLWAKGGIAAAIGREDTPEIHAADTLSAGAGLSDPEGALRLAEAGAENLEWLLDAGVKFDRARNGSLALTQEAAHRYPRIVHAGGDATGHALIKALVERVAITPSIKVLENTLAYDLIASHGKVQGLLTHSSDKGWTAHQSTQLVLATGGIGMAWWHTTNPGEATGDGLAMAARAGARMADLEFVQFHPTALAVDNTNNGASLPLLTEALRGAGALLLDESGRRFMPDEHPAAEMAPRDVVARAIEKHTRAGRAVYLDLRPALSSGQGATFPQALAACEKAGYRPGVEPVPVTTAAHYHMGGIQTDARGRTSVDGLWACGEVATTGVHGANRLASNSLLEALVYARRVAADIGSAPDLPYEHRMPVLVTPNYPDDTACTQLEEIVAATRALMSRHVAVLRSGPGLEKAGSLLSGFDQQLHALEKRQAPGSASSREVITRWSETRNIVLVARLVTLAALRREESRGAHYRDDYPQARTEWQRQQTLTVDTLQSHGPDCL